MVVLLRAGTGDVDMNILQLQHQASVWGWVA